MTNEVLLLRTQEENDDTPTVYWSVPMERSIMDQAVQSLLLVAGYNAPLGYSFMGTGYQRTDVARNRLAQTFKEISKHPDDTLVMLDADHIHPMDIVQRLANHPHQIGVVGARYYRRGEPYDLQFYIRNPETGKLHGVINPVGLIEGAAIGTGAIAIKRWVFDALDDAGLGYPYFQYDYTDCKTDFQSEDIFFALQCEKIGIHHYCNADITSDHLISTVVNKNTFDAYIKLHPEKLVMTQLSAASYVLTENPADHVVTETI